MDPNSSNPTAPRVDESRTHRLRGFGLAWLLLLGLAGLACAVGSQWGPVGATPGATRGLRAPASDPEMTTAWGQDLDRQSLKRARETITPEEIEAHLTFLAAPELEGRDSPSRGLDRAAEFLEAELRSYGYRGPIGQDSFRQTYSRALPAPAQERCGLVVEGQALVLGNDFVPLPGCSGEGRGQAIFVGFGIDRRGYDDLARRKLKGRVAVILEGEPRHRRLFEGPDVLTEAADVYDKVQALVAEDVAGVLVVRRPPAAATGRRDRSPAMAPELGYRYTWARWNPRTTERAPRRRNSFKTPVLEITAEVASRILGEDVLALAARIDESGKPKQSRGKGATVELSSGFENRAVAIDNVVGFLEGSDPELRDQVIVLGAHFDHIGVDSWGRVGFGADDNGSGTAAMLEVAEALAGTPPRRSVLVVFFSAEEDGLLGSRHFVESPPVPRENMIAMLNMDMVGRGKKQEVVVLGTRHNPDLKDVLKRAAKLKGSGVREVVTDSAQHLWERSDHYSFHRAGVPVLFFFEAVSETLNEDYHTFRDTVDLVDCDKVVNTARLCLHVTWLLAQSDQRPGPPR